MKLRISDFEVKKMYGVSDHIYLVGSTEIESQQQEIEVFFENRLQEKRVFEPAELLLSGELVKNQNGYQLLNATIDVVKLLIEIDLSSLSIKERLNASGLIHEFRLVYRNDKYRALEILKVLGVSERFAEEILVKNTYMLPFI